MYYFQLLEQRAVGLPGLRRATVRPMKSFCQLNAADFDSLNEVFVAAVLKMHQEYLEMKKTLQINLMNFPVIIARAVNYIEDLLCAMPEDLASFKQRAFN